MLYFLKYSFSVMIIWFCFVSPLQVGKKPMFCEICSVHFESDMDYYRHLDGKRHATQLKKIPSRQELLLELNQCPKSWSDVNVDDTLPLWAYSELSSLGFKYRSQCLHPSPVLRDLNSFQKARVWRYMRDVMGLSYYSEIALVMTMIDDDEYGHLRVKEVFESFEVYKKIVTFLVNAQKTIRHSNGSEITNIVDLACGHGLVGVLLAYRFNRINVHLFDISKRPTFDAFIRAFEAYGLKRPNAVKVLPNVFFHEKDIKYASDYIANSIVICTHACGQLNQDGIEMALTYGAAGWIVTPCCISHGMYLGESCIVQLNDYERHAMLCGALAYQYNAQIIDSIDSRITNRAIVIAGGVGLLSQAQSVKEDKDENSESLLISAKRRNMPKLIQS